MKYFFIKTLFLIGLGFFFFINPNIIFAYTQYMPASVVLGQPDFVSSGAGLSSTGLNNPIKSYSDGNHIFVADLTNNRVLIWNSVPTQNNKPADLVLGQPDFTSNTLNNGGLSANSMNGPSYVFSDGVRLYVVDKTNNRVLVWNSIPTQTNQAADYVIGQPNLTTNSPGDTASKFNNPLGVMISNGKLFISEANNHRVLIFNSVPTASNASADVVVGQVDMTTNSTGSTASLFSSANGARGMFVYNNKLIVSDSGNNRVLVWNSVPTTNGVAADYVLGQPDMTSNTANNGGINCAVLSTAEEATVTDNGRLIISDRQRMVVFNQFPTTTFQSADFVFGQPDCTTKTANFGGISDKSLNGNIRVGNEINNKLIVSDSSNNRILIYNEVKSNPALTLNNSAEDRGNGILRLKGTVNVASTYNVREVNYSINGAASIGATATDGSFNSSQEDFYFDFDPKLNQPSDSSNNLIGGYTVDISTRNTNMDLVDHLFFFSPFDLQAPVDNAIFSTSYPTFEFTVNGQRSNMGNNLSKYQVVVKSGGSNSHAPWRTLIDDIPVNFSAVAQDSTNLKRSYYPNSDSVNGNGTYETDKFLAIYSNNSTRIKVYSKTTSLSLTNQWKISALDKSGHSQDTPIRTFYSSGLSGLSTPSFPLALLNISGFGNPNLNIYNLAGARSTFNISSINPDLYGIVWAGSRVTVKLTKQNCKIDCIQSFSTLADQSSRFGINIPNGILFYGSKYTVNLSASHEDRYVELPQFTLVPTGYAPVASSQYVSLSNPQSVIQTPTPSTSPVDISPTPITPEVKNNKTCIWFICW